MTLCESMIDQIYTVVDIQTDLPLARRLESIGLTEHAKLKVVNKKKNGSMIIKVRGSRWAIGKMLSTSIFVKEEA